MAIVRIAADELQQSLTKEQIEMLDKLKDYPIVYDEDCPKLTPQQIEKLKALRQANPLKTAI